LSLLFNICGEIHGALFVGACAVGKRINHRRRRKNNLSCGQKYLYNAIIKDSRMKKWKSVVKV
jgi:hypothetical protein